MIYNFECKEDKRSKGMKLFLLMDENRCCNNDLVMTAEGLIEFCNDLALPEDKERSQPRDGTEVSRIAGGFFFSPSLSHKGS